MAGNVSASLQYLMRLELYEEEKPFQLFVEIPKDAPDQRRNNLEFEEKTHVIHDIRDNVSLYTLDDNGFMIRPFSTALSFDSFTDRLAIERTYLPEVEQLIRKEVVDVERVFFFDWRIRSSDAKFKSSEIDMNDLTTTLLPAPHVHVDQSTAAVLHRVRLHFGKEADFLLGGRVRIINVWRPLLDPVEDYSLAVCDPTTVAEDELVECDHIRKRFSGETIYVHHSENQSGIISVSRSPSRRFCLRCLTPLIE